MPKLLAVCGRCGSDHVKADAYAEWNADAQEWELSQTFDKGAFCNKCDGETSIYWKEIVQPSQPTLFELRDDDRPVSERNVASPLKRNITWKIALCDSSQSSGEARWRGKGLGSHVES